MLEAESSAEQVVTEEEILAVSFSERLGGGVGFWGATKKSPDWEDSEEGLTRVSFAVFWFWGFADWGDGEGGRGLKAGGSSGKDETSSWPNHRNKEIN